MPPDAMQPVSEVALHYLRLSLAKGIGPHTGRQLIRACGSIDRLWELNAAELQQIDGVGPKLAASLATTDTGSVEKIIRRCKASGIALLSPEDALYPQSLLPLDDAPLLLYVKGDAGALNRTHMLAVVGARRASREGQLLARRWSAFLAARDVCIVSGMASGIDSAAHGGALEGSNREKPATIAVLGCGLTSLATPEQQRQLEAITANGCALSEFAPDIQARPEHFPRRNRIIAGLAEATLVIEADLKSGSLITARLAAEYGREVFAVPGSVLSGTHAGCHQLIRDGATLVESAAAIPGLLGWGNERNKERRTNYEPADDREAAIIALLEREIAHIDRIAEVCGLTVPELSPILLALELLGIVERVPGSRYCLTTES